MLTKIRTPTTVDHDVEGRLNDVTRLAHALWMVSESVWSEIEGMANGLPQLREALKFLEADLEVMRDQILELDCQARDLRKAYYG